MNYERSMMMMMMMLSKSTLDEEKFKIGRAIKARHSPWSSLVEGDEGFIGPIGKLLVVVFLRKPKRLCNILYLFDFWANPLFHLLLLKSPIMPSQKQIHHESIFHLDMLPSSFTTLGSGVELEAES